MASSNITNMNEQQGYAKASGTPVLVPHSGAYIPRAVSAESIHGSREYAPVYYQHHSYNHPQHQQHQQHHSHHQQHQHQHQQQSNYEHVATRSRSNSPVAGGSGSNGNGGTSGKSQTVFIHKLFDMLEDQSLAHLIWWSPTQDSFFLYPGEEFSNVLAQYFKHTNIASFIRQLNMYGFHKVNDNFQSEEKHQSNDSSDQHNSNNQQPQHQQQQTRWEFRHSANYFRKGDVESLSLIKRKSSKVASSQKEIVSLKTLPPTSSGQIDDSAKNPQTQEQYHSSVYQHSWNQLGGPPAANVSSTTGSSAAGSAAATGRNGSLSSKDAARQSAYGGVAPVMVNGPAPGQVPVQVHGPGPYAYPVYAQSMAIPHSPSSPAHSEPPMASPSYFLHSPSYPPASHSSRQASVPTPGVSLEQSANFRMIEMNTALNSLKVAYSDLLARHESLALSHQKSQADLLHLTEIVEGLVRREKAEESASKDPESVVVDRSSVKTPVNRINSPSQDNMSPTTVVIKAPNPAEVGTFRNQLKNKITTQAEPSVARPVPKQQSYSLNDLPSAARVAVPGIVPQQYPLNPNYSLYNTGEAPLRKNADEAEQQKPTGSAPPSAHRQVSGLPDPLQQGSRTASVAVAPETVVISSPVTAAATAPVTTPISSAATASTAPAPAPAPTTSNSASTTAVGGAGAGVGGSKTEETPAYVQSYQPFQPVAHAYYQHMVHDPSHLRTSSLPVMSHPLPQRIAASVSPQRHSLNSLVHPRIEHEEEARTIAVTPAFSKTPSEEPSAGAPHGHLTKKLPSMEELNNSLRRASSSGPIFSIHSAPEAEDESAKRRKLDE